MILQLFRLSHRYFMSKKEKMSSQIEGFQNNPDYVIFNNPLSNPKFVRKLSRTETKSINEIYTPKLFIEIASRLKPEHLEGLKRNENVSFVLNIREFLEEIEVNPKHGYGYLVDSADMLQSTVLKWTEGSKETSVTVISKMIHDKGSGKIEFFIDSDLAQKILQVKDSENFSFLKKNFYKLQNGQAIRLYQFFKSWLKGGRYETGLERFKEQFGYNTSGYVKFSNFESRVLKPATEEISEKTDIVVTYEPTGDNLNGQRPRVTGLIFRITAKEKVKSLPDGKPHQAPQPVTATQEDETAAPPKPASYNENELYDLFRKIPIKNKPDEITAKVLIESWVQLLGSELVKDGFLGIVATKAHPDTVAFFTESNFKKYKGYSKKQEEQEEQKRIKQEAQRTAQEQKRFIDRLTEQYKKDKKAHYDKKYNELTQEQKEIFLTELWEEANPKSIYFRNNEKSQPNGYAIEKIAESLTFPNGYDHQTTLKNYALKTFKVHIDFDSNGEIKLIG